MVGYRVDEQYKIFGWNNDMITWDGKIINPDPDVLLPVIEKHPGITLQKIHNLNYLSVFDTLRFLIDEEKIFLIDGRYYPNH